MISLLCCPLLQPTILLAAELQGQEATTYGDRGAQFLLWSLLVAVVAVVVTNRSTRALEGRKVRRLMHVKSEEQGSVVLEELKADEEPARRAPEFVVVDAASRPEAAVAARDRLVARERSVFWWAIVTDVLAVFAYALAGVWSEEARIIAFLLGAFTLIRPVVWIGYSRADTGCLAMLVRSIPQAVWADPTHRPHLTGLALGAGVLWGGLALFDGHLLAWLGLWIATAIHFVLNAILMASFTSGPNLKLVVLRVFGETDAAAFTFNGLLKSWRHFGTFFTVVDPSYLKSRSRHSAPFLGGLAIGILALLFGLSFWVDARERDPTFYVWTMVVPAALLLGGSYAGVILGGVGRGFVRSRDDLVARLQRLDAWPRRLDLSFRNMPLMCHDDTWRIAVSECVKASDAVLMDLRGFSQERQGCRWEVDYLLDAHPIDRVVFLVEPEAVTKVEQLVLELWAELRSTSPNLHRKAPRAQIYRTSDKDGEDMQGMLDVLLQAASVDRADDQSADGELG